MNYAVKLFSSVGVVDKPAGIPGNWPAEIVDLREGVALPEGTGWTLMTENQLASHKTTYQSEYDTWYSAYARKLALNDMVNSRIRAAMEFGKQLMVEYGTKNVLAGYTTAQILAIADKLSKLQSLLLSGSVYAALEEINALVPDANVTQESIDEFKAKVKNFLGIA